MEPSTPVHHELILSVNHKDCLYMLFYHSIDRGIEIWDSLRVFPGLQAILDNLNFDKLFIFLQQYRCINAQYIW